MRRRGSKRRRLVSEDRVILWDVHLQLLGYLDMEGKGLGNIVSIMWIS